MPKDAVAAPVCFSGSKVLEGFGSLLVLAVGPNSQQGLINAAVLAGKAGGGAAGGSGAVASGGGAAKAEPLRQQTALSAKLEVLARDIGRVGMAAAGGTLLINTAAATADLAAAGRLAAPWALEPDALQRYLDALITSITLLVVAVPEGLPLAVTLALAFSVARMLSDNNLVRHLDACETMAGCTTICRCGGMVASSSCCLQLVFALALALAAGSKNRGFCSLQLRSKRPLLASCNPRSDKTGTLAANNMCATQLRHSLHTPDTFFLKTQRHTVTRPARSPPTTCA